MLITYLLSRKKNPDPPSNEEEKENHVIETPDKKVISVDDKTLTATDKIGCQLKLSLSPVPSLLQSNAMRRNRSKLNSQLFK